MTLKLVLWGDGDSPHLLKWARGLATMPDIELWAASSRGFLPGFEACVPAHRRLALNTQPQTAGGNVGLLRQLPRLVRWLKQVDAQWVHAHYLTSHGTLAWLARGVYGLRAQVVGSAWGSDILDTPQHSALVRMVTGRVLRACALTTSDSQFMAQRMRSMGAREVMVFPFGLEAMPAPAAHKDANLFFANRGLEPLYEPARVLQQFAALSGPDGRLVVANDGSMRSELEQLATQWGLHDRVHFVGRLDSAAQAQHYDRARWYLSLPRTDSVSVSVLEAMAHGCVPILSDLPANRELVHDGDNGLIVPAGQLLPATALQVVADKADTVAARNRQWVAHNALFEPSLAKFVTRLKALS
jgi:glycosyltransferase involved in cell wall biosynthesis